MSTGAFGYVNLLKSAADASWTREEVLTNNIANVDTPNYKGRMLNLVRILPMHSSVQERIQHLLHRELIMLIIMIWL